MYSTPSTILNLPTPPLFGRPSSHPSHSTLHHGLFAAAHFQYGLIFLWIPQLTDTCPHPPSIRPSLLPVAPPNHSVYCGSVPQTPLSFLDCPIIQGRYWQVTYDEVQVTPNTGKWADKLNKECPCDGTWTAGKQRTLLSCVPGESRKKKNGGRGGGRERASE